jgi:hypothetical protein
MNRLIRVLKRPQGIFEAEKVRPEICKYERKGQGLR